MEFNKESAKVIKNKKTPLEREIQRKILLALKSWDREIGIFFYKAIANSKRGVPDIIALYKGKFVAIEVKTFNGEQSFYQLKIEQEIQQNGGYYILATSAEQVTDFLKDLDGQI